MVANPPGGSGGFSGSSPGFWTYEAGFDPVMKIDGRRKYVKRYMEKLIKDREKRAERKRKKQRLNSTRSSQAMEENDVPVRIAVSEQRIKDLNVVVVRVNTAIEKLSEVNTSVSRMLALHEERISKQEEIDSIYLKD